MAWRAAATWLPMDQLYLPVRDRCKLTLTTATTPLDIEILASIFAL